MNHQQLTENFVEAIQLYDLVALVKALPAYKLRRDEVGVVIDIGPDNQYVVEFSNPNGIPYATLTVANDELMKVYLHADMVG